MSDLDRLRNEYAKRQIKKISDYRYSQNNPEYNFTITQRHRSLIKLLSKQGIETLTDMRLLEVGCGSGGVLIEYQNLGIKPTHLYGIDLLFDRLLEAHNRLPESGISNVDAQDLPFPTNSFDIVLQYTAFSSILDFSIKKRMAEEMQRVIKQDGTIIWYDFWWNPTNRQTRGIRSQEIRKLFSQCSHKLRKITLAPPIARILVPISGKVACFLESIMFLNSHYLVLIKKLEGSENRGSGING